MILINDVIYTLITLFSISKSTRFECLFLLISSIDDYKSHYVRFLTALSLESIFLREQLHTTKRVRIFGWGSQKKKTCALLMYIASVSIPGWNSVTLVETVKASTWMWPELLNTNLWLCLWRGLWVQRWAPIPDRTTKK